MEETLFIRHNKPEAPLGDWDHRGQLITTAVYKQGGRDWVIHGVGYGIYQINNVWLIGPSNPNDEQHISDIGPFPTMKAVVVAATLLDES